MTSAVSFIVVIGILIFVHELGHFLVAKGMGVKVLRFSLGFGPKLLGTKRGDTEYWISAVPLGGYVKMLGEDPQSEVPEEEKENSFSAQGVWKRIAIVFAGPFSNLLLAVLFFALIYVFYGVPHATTEIGSVTEGSPAAEAGLQKGDRITTINGQAVADWEELSRTIEREGTGELELRVRRNGEVFTVTVTPEVQEVENLFGESVRRPLIGITASGKFDTEKVNPFKALYYSLVQTWMLCKLFFLTVIKLIQRVLPMETLGGPIFIAQMAGEQAKEGLAHLVHFTALISVNLAILNLLPIPMLDGGHLFFFLIEAVRGKPLEMKKMEMAQKVGILILLMLMILVFYNDIARIITDTQPQP